MNLLESYKGRLKIAEEFYKQNNEGESLSFNKKSVTAVVLNNTVKFLNEAFSNSVGTQRADLGNFKKFCLSLTTLVVPSLISHELVLVQPMTSLSGYFVYVKYTIGSNKGASKQGDLVNSPFQIGKPDVNYTSHNVVETVPASTTELTLAWTPIVKGYFKDDSGVAKDVKIMRVGGTVEYADVTEEGKVTGLAEGDRVAYVYDNVVIPQNDLPIVNAEIAHITLEAKARRVAIYYSQIAAFQAKNDYGFDLGDSTAKQACGRLNYEIDCEVIELLIELAKKQPEVLEWNKTLPYGVSKAEHYEGFSEVIDEGSRILYDRTQRFSATYMVCSSSLVPIFGFIKTWRPADRSKINGPYFAGTLNGIKVFVTPNIEKDTFILGVNGDDMQSSAAIYAPYMALVPTQLLGFADGGMSQGFSTMYGLAPLNDLLVVAGKVTHEDEVVITKASE